ncbi:hypothetical protein DB32_003969 [Sandaracinus amylolyticus]|uniref:Peptidase C-terminal archaeal/bacterial domain-containing protein n=2 Tax=Sandaracinus amylolyticus TaxID=927083 RepID=A0A0F6YIL2_9BACT|nr:hypothetical protein DB32_003969 [Sandaracinus amylolyticus]
MLAAIVLVLAGCGTSTAAPDAGIAAPPRAAEFRSPRVDTMLESASRVIRTRGFTADGDATRGFLLEQATEVRSTSMRTGSCYVALGVGSSAMRELDLRVFDGDGAEVARDAEQGPIAALRFCPAQNGTYFVAVRASAGSGLYATRTFRGPTGIAFRVDDVLRAVAPAVAPTERDPG